MAWWDEVKAKYRPSGTGGHNPTDEEIREILEDPDVSDETKRELIAAWNYDYATGYIPGDIFIQERTGYNADAVPDEVKEYIEEYDAQDYVDNYAANAMNDGAVSQAVNDAATIATGENPGALPGSGNPSADMQAAVEQAKNERRYADKVEEQAEGANQLQSYADQLKATGSTGAASSREIFDSGEIGLDFFRLFWGKYGRFRSGVEGLKRSGSPNKGNNGGSSSYSSAAFTGMVMVDMWIFKGMYNEQREVEFGRIEGEITRNSQAVDSLQRHIEELTTTQSSLFDMWEGEAADAASLTYDNAVSQARTLVNELDNTSKVLHEVRGALEQMCLTKAQTVNGLFSSTIGGVGPDTIDQLVTVARGGASDTDILDVASQFGIPAQQECLDISDDVKAEVQQSAIDWCLGNLVPVVETTFEAFTDVCDSTDEGFEEILGVMRDAFGQSPEVGSSAGPRSGEPIPK